jgi:hypothetical protein
MAPPTTQRAVFCPVLIIFILINYLIPMQLFNAQEVAWLVLSAAWRLNLCRELNGRITRETLSGSFNLPRGGCLRSGVINAILEEMGIVSSPIFHLFTGFVKPLPHTWAESCQPLPKKQTPAPAMRPY